MGKNKEINQGIAMAMGLAMILGITGCAGKEEPDRPRQDVLAEDGVQKGIPKDYVQLLFSSGNWKKVFNIL